MDAEGSVQRITNSLIGGVNRDSSENLAETDENGVVHKRREIARFLVKKFHHRFRMNPNLFQIIYENLTVLEVGSVFFQGRSDGVGQSEPSTLLKVVVAIRQLAYGTNFDHVHECIRVAGDIASL